MTTGATSQLGLALPVQGELSGTWGDTVNNGITQYTNIAIAATLTLTGDGAVTLANTTGDASASNITSTLSGAGTVTAQFAIVQVSGTTTTKVITGPSYSKTYLVDNASSFAVTFKASGQTGVSIAAAEKVTVFYNGTDYVKLAGTIANAAGSNTQIQFNNGGLFGASANLTWDGTTLSSTQVNITGQGTLRLQDTTGGEYVGLRSPGTLSASYTLTFPADDGTSGQALITDGSGVLSWSTAASGDVYGPASSTDNAVARFDSTTGKLLQNSVVLIGDTGAVTGVTDLTTTGNTILGNDSTDTVTVNGYMGVGSAGVLSSAGVYITNSALVGVSVFGARFGVTANSGNTTSIQSIYSQVLTAAGAYTVTNVNGARFADASLGAGSTITNQRGVYIEDQTRGTNNYGLESLVSSGTNKWNIYSSGTADNYFAGNVGVGVSAPAAKIDLSANAVIMGYFRSSGGSANDQRLTFTSGGGRVVLDAATNSTGASSAFGFTLGGTEGMRLTTTGLGIGTTSPTNALSVTGNANITGNVTLGDATTDTVTVNGYMGVGGAGGSNIGLYVRNTALTGTTQYGVSSTVTGNSAATSNVIAIEGAAKTAAETFTSANVQAFYAADVIKGAGSTITNQHGLRVLDQTQGTNNYGITSLVTSGTNKWNIYASGTAQNYFAGDVGIGTTSPAFKLDVTGNIRTSLGVMVKGSSLTAAASQVTLDQLNTTTSRLVSWGADTSTAGILYLGTLSSNASVGSASALVINASQNVGIGVTPSAWGSGYKAIQLLTSSLYGTTSRDMNLGANVYVDAVGYKYIQTSFATNYTQYQGAHSWYTAASGTAGNAITFTQAMTLDASGNLLVGTTSALSNPTTGITFLPASGASNAGMGHVTGTASGSGYWYFAYNGSNIGSITQSGTTAVLYNTTSDQRLKENIQDADSASTLIDSLQVRQFDWKADGSHQRYGFVAQELVTVAPEAVNQPEDTEEMMAVDYSKLVPMLVKEIQSLRKRLADAGI
jgi:hypothetical protein